MGKNKRVKLLLILISIVIPIAVGLYIRFNDLSVWNKYRSFFYYKDRPLFTSYDAFYFARYGKDYLNGRYKAKRTDTLRFVPDNYITNNVTYPSLIPMESWLGAEVAKFKNTHIENVALWLTPILAVLFVVPLVLYLFKLELPVAGFGGALLGSISLMYLVRTSIVRFDTDSLNLFFPFAIALFLLRSFYSKGREKYLNLTIAGILAQGYCWWYAHTGLMLVILLTYLVDLSIFDRESSLKQKTFYFLTLFIFSNPVFVFNGIFNIVGLVKTYLIDFFRPSVNGFPNVFMSISEAQHFNILRISKLSAGNFFVFIAGFAGTVLLFIRKFKETFLLLPIFLIGIMALKGGNRFAMYLSPFIGIGVGYFFDFLISYFQRLKTSSYQVYVAKLLSIFLLAGVFLYTNKSSFKFVAQPKITPELESDFIKLNTITPKDSWIWTWWDYGTAIQYLGDRATFHDGQSQGSPKTYFIATTFSTSKPKVAHNVILGIANIGEVGIKKLLKKEKRKPEEIKNLMFSGNFSKPVKNPIYWAFTGDEIGKFAWINYFGTWDFDLKKGIKSPIYPLHYCKIVKPNVFKCGKLLLDLNKGKLIQNMKNLPIKKFVVKNKTGLIEKDFNPEGIYIELIKRYKRGYLFLMNEQPFRSMFNQMYILRNYDKRYFTLVYDDFPTMVLYKVKNSGSE